MLRHYWILALRNLMANKTTSVIKILGLALGMLTLFLVLIVNYSEMTWDSFWKDADRIYLVRTEPFIYNGMRHVDSITASNFKKVRAASNELWMTQIARSMVTVNEVAEGKVSPLGHRIEAYQVASDFLKIFEPRVISGDTTEFFHRPDVALISQSTALRLFGEGEPIGRVIQFSLLDPKGDLIETKTLNIIAVVDIDNPRSHLSPGVYFPEINSDLSAQDDEYLLDTYVKAIGNISVKDIVGLFDQAARLNLAGEIKQHGPFPTHSLLAITDRHLNGAAGDGHKKRIIILSVLAGLVLIVAISNFINLSLAGYVARQKEVAIRRINGAGIKDLLTQYWLETLMYVFLATLVALVGVEWFVPRLSEELQLPLVDGIFVDPILALLCFGLAISVALVIALYPAVYFSRIRPGEILKANRSTENSLSIYTRKVLLAMQFVCVSALVIGLGAIYLQIKHISSYNPGYKTHNTLMLLNQSELPPTTEKIALIKSQLASLPGFLAAASTLGDIPGRDERSMTIGAVANGQPQTHIAMFEWIADPDYFKTLAINLLAEVPGAIESAFSANKSGNASFDVVLCRSTADALGYRNANDALSQEVELFKQGEGSPRGRVVAVVEDVHLGDHRKAPTDCIFLLLGTLDNVGRSPLAVSWDHAPTQEELHQIKQIWETHSGAQPHYWNFSGSLADRYKNEKRIQFFISIFTLVGLAVGLSGIYGMTALATQKRIREIALRKIHGASSWQIVNLLNRDLGVVVIAANIIAWPLAISFVVTWLESFHEHFSIHVWLPVFCIAALFICLVMVYATVAGHSLRISQLRPAEALRDD